MRRLLYLVLFASCPLAFAGNVEILDRADRAMDNCLYEEAIALYQRIVDSDDIMLRIARAYSELGNHQQTLHILKTIPEPLERDTRLFLCQTEKRLGLYQQALKTASLLDADPEIQLLRGQLLYELQQYALAKELLSPLSDPPAQLYLARIELALGDLSSANERLENLARRLLATDLLHYEIAFVQGDLFFQKRDYAQAASYYSKAIPERNAEKAPWHASALYQLAVSAQRIAETSCDPNDFERAESLFNRLHAAHPSEQTTLALAQCLLSRSACLKDVQAYERATAHCCYATRDQYYAQCADAYYSRGLNNLREAQALINTNRSSEAGPYLQRALALFTQALEGSVSKDILQGLSVCLSLLKESSGQPDILQRLLNQPSDDPEFLLFLKGQLLAQKEGANPVEIIETLSKVVSSYPAGNYADTALYTLALWHLHQGELKTAETTFLQLQERYPQSSYAAEALFWSVDCAERTGSDRTQIQQRLSKLFETYSSSPWAEEAYFLVYPYEDYMAGTKESIAHLQGFEKRFPSSPYLITAHYLLGKQACQPVPGSQKRQQTTWNRAIEHFSKAELLFDQLYAEGAIAPHQLEYFAVLRYRASLERAQANLSIALESIGAKRQVCIAYSTSSYHDILSTLSDLTCPLSAYLSQGETHKYLMEECRYGLAQAYLKSDADVAAQQLLQQLVDQYRTATVTRGYFLARAQRDLATLSIKHGDHSSALRELELAEEAAKGRILNTDERLDLWMQQSQCHEALGQYDIAMRLLSKVINDDSISGLRLKAMLKRAEIYEKQNRTDLAQKQLIALSRKGGEWAKKAQEKLAKHYDYH